MRSNVKPMLVIGAAIVVMVTVSLLVQVTSKEIVPWREDYSAAQIEAVKDHKPRLLYFTANWCDPCTYMKRTTFASASVKAALEKFVPVKINVDAHQDLVKQYSVGPIPAFIVLDADGRFVREITGAMSADEFIDWLNGK